MSSFDYERRFGGINRLYSANAVDALQKAHVMVAGIGGVGSWTVEALARSGVGQITLIDLDVIAESNINRQIHALSSTLGQAKVEAMAARIKEINPSCVLTCIDDFIEETNVAAILDEHQPQVLLDCTDQAKAKIAMLLACRKRKIPFLMCGGAGGKTNPLSLQCTDLAVVKNDALLARLRNILRKEHGFAKGSDKNGKALKKVPKMQVSCLWFDQVAQLPTEWLENKNAPQGLSCAGYGSLVTVTANMGMAAAHWALEKCINP